MKRLDIRGRIKVLHGQNRKAEEPPLALFALCTPFGPPSLLEIPHKEVMFKSKHKLDLALVSMDQRGKMLLGYSDAELANLGGYDLVHFDDLAYVASAHQELLKTGASGMIAYRFQTKEGQWQWLQTSSRLVYKNSKPDFVISTHRPLMEEEGRDLLGKRTMDFKVSYLDAGLTNSYFSDTDVLLGGAGSQPPAPLPGSTTPQRLNRRYKTQLRDFLSTCRTKRKLSSHSSPAPAPPTDYLADSSTAAAVAAAYNMYGSYPAATPPDNVYMSHSYNQGLYDNRFLTTTENLFHQYRPLGSYYTEYHPPTPYVTNGFLDVSPRPECVEQKYAPTKCAEYAMPVVTVPLCGEPQKKTAKTAEISPVVSSPSDNGLVTPKMEDMKDVNLCHYEVPRQTVLMWGSGPTLNTCRTPPSPSHHPYLQDKKFTPSDPLKSLAEMNSMSDGHVVKWKPETPPSPKYYQQYEGGSTEVWAPHHQYYPYHHHHHSTGGESSYPQISRTGVLCCPSLR